MLYSERNTLLQTRYFGSDSKISAPHPQFLSIKNGPQIPYSFNYIKFKIYSVSYPVNGWSGKDWEGGSCPKVQFTKFQFYSDNGQVFDYGSKSSTKSYFENYNGESFNNALTNSTDSSYFPKLCGYATSGWKEKKLEDGTTILVLNNPIEFNVTLNSNTLNIKKYTNWRMYGTADTGTYKRFALGLSIEASTDNDRWYMLINDKTRTKCDSQGSYGKQCDKKIKMEI